MTRGYAAASYGTGIGFSRALRRRLRAPPDGGML
jgi:hypothetical protein